MMYQLGGRGCNLEGWGNGITVRFSRRALSSGFILFLYMYSGQFFCTITFRSHAHNGGKVPLFLRTS
jgi:hypothetical protein